MIKKFCLAILCLAMGIAVSAQTTEARPDVEEIVEYDANPHRIITNPFWGNWFVTLGGGAQIYMGDADSEAAFGKRVSGAMDIAVGKWFTPAVGARLTFSGFTAKGASSASSTSDKFFAGEIPGTRYNYSKFPVYHLHGDFLLNAHSLFLGYDPERVWNLIPYAGIGWAFHYGDNEPTVNVGVINGFSICKALDFNVDIRGMLINDVFDREVGGMNWEGLLSATVGVTYKFGKNDWDRPKTVTRIDHTEANALLKKLNAANAENESLKKSLADAETKVQAAPKEVVKSVAADDIVLFPIGESKLTKAGQVALGGFAAMIKDLDPNAVYVITGYADKGTGSKTRNEKLSKARAEAAYKCLVEKYGVNPEQLKVDYKGGVDNMYFNDPSLSRAVVISME